MSHLLLALSLPLPWILLLPRIRILTLCTVILTVLFRLRLFLHLPFYLFFFSSSVTSLIPLFPSPALLILGTEFTARSSRLDLGLSDLVDRVGQQTGLYGTPIPPGQWRACSKYSPLIMSIQLKKSKGFSGQDILDSLELFLESRRLFRLVCCSRNLHSFPSPSHRLFLFLFLFLFLLSTFTFLSRPLALPLDL